MSDLKNTPKVAGGIIDLNRAQIEHRAAWMALMFEEAEKAGFNMEESTRRAIKRMGNFHGAFFKDSLGNDDGFDAFKSLFFNGIAIKTFEMDNIEISENELKVEFNYCPLLSAWQKLGISDEQCNKLCDIAMDGDRGIAETLGYKLELTDTIASGCNSCKMRFYK